MKPLTTDALNLKVQFHVALPFPTWFWFWFCWFSCRAMIFFNRHTLRNTWVLQLQLFLRLITPEQKRSTRKHTGHLFQH